MTNARAIELWNDLSDDFSQLLESGEGCDVIIYAEKGEWLRQDPVQILELVFQNQACKSLRDYCLSAICENPGLVFDSSKFLQIDESILILLLRRDDLAMKEIAVWEHLRNWGMSQNPLLKYDVEEWSTNDFATLEATLHQCIPLVRWFQIQPFEFSRKVRPFRKILPEGLYEDIITHHLDPETELESTVLPARVAPKKSLDKLEETVGKTKKM
ncbi:1495_t:CDS:2 [Ambispora leptoticha]|uniref:1495_t:CDS:1 n=1 Tax=Ambispora leptoticha TaxID=144679 RepID=A0A9N9EZH7_9GLOM|nr:1495_t:CDS:2 [Ambispora leptoticha]